MKQKRARSFRTKLLLYFSLFAVFIFLVLWLLQTVFLQSLYDFMVIRNTRKIADELVEILSKERLDSEVLNQFCRENSLLIAVCDEKANLDFLADEHGDKLRYPMVLPDGRHEMKPKEEFPEDYEPPYGVMIDFINRLDEDKQAFLKAVAESKTGRAEVREKTFFEYGVKYTDPWFTGYDWTPEQTTRYLLVRTNLEPVGSSVMVIRTMLIWVTGLSLVFAFILSWFLARRFASPVKRLSEKAGKLGESDYSAEYPKGFSTELDELSDTLDQTNEKLLAAKQYQNELLANVSHDLRTPITMIKGYAEMINDISFEDREQCREDMQVIARESDRLTALVNEILAYPELQSVEKIDCSTVVDLSKLTISASDDFAVLAKAEGITVSSEIAENVFVAGSRSHLERMLFNLLENAARHVGADKTILVSLTVAGDTVRLSVTDRGEGIPAEGLAHIWDRYYTARQRDGKGVSGLGLAIVKQIATLHGGHCEVSSTPGAGSTFSVALPTVRPTSAE